MASNVKTEMFWVIEYKNGKILPEFEPPNIRNSFSKVNHKDVLRIWWLPVTQEMTGLFKETRYNPLLRKQGVEVKGAKGFVTRRVVFEMAMGSRKETAEEQFKRMLTQESHRVKCYVIGIEGGPRREIYPDGRVLDYKEPQQGESQDELHHG